MATDPGFDLDSKAIGSLPLVNHFLRRLRFDQALARHLPPPDPRSRIPPQRVLGVLIRNLVLARLPLYSVGDWCRQWVPALLGLESEEVALLGDDRTGRALDRLFDADRSALLTELVVRMVKEFRICLDQLHNDSTTLTLHGEYDEATGELVRGKPTLVVVRGHNKDHRPDLKQLLWILTVSADGAIPVHFKVADGNTEDSTTHIETWEILRQLVGSADFLYVADSKLCTHENLKHIHEEGGRFVTVLPRSRKEDGLFRDWLQENTPLWEDVVRKPHPRLKDGPPDIIRVFPSPIPEANGFRILWYHSSHKTKRDAQARGDTIQSAWKALEALRAKLEGPRPRYRTQGAVAGAAEKILSETGAGRWVACEVTSFQKATFHQEKRGRPGKKTRWRRRLKTRFRLTWSLRQEQIAYDTRCDGIFPLITNSKDFSARETLEVYKSKQPLVEKRHDLLKNVQAATPVYLQNISRIEALLFLHFVALLVHALIEREIRRRMEARGTKRIPLYPEQRNCKAPSTARVLQVFDGLQRHLLYKDAEPIQRFDPELTDLHRKILRLLGVAHKSFMDL